VLLDHDANVHLKNPEGCDALIIAVLSEVHNEEVVAALLEKGANPNSTFTDDCDREEMSVLISATLTQQEDVVKLLLKYQADPNYKCRDGFTALHVAAYRDLTRVFTELITYHADWRRYGPELLELASGRNSAIAEKLISYGVDPQRADGRTVDLARLTKNRIIRAKKALDKYATGTLRPTFVRGERIEGGKRR
jgi:ankyrin repeat protein